MNEVFYTHQIISWEKLCLNWMNLYFIALYKTYPQETVELSTNMVKDIRTISNPNTQLFVTVETK